MRHAELRRLLTQGRPVVALHPGATVATRRWAPERFAAVGDILAARYGACIVILGNQRERALCETVRQRMRAPALNVAGQTSMGVVAALLAQVALLVANDSGLAHLAVAVGATAVVVFGAAQAETWAPRERTRYRWLSVSVPCRPCALTECPIGYRCLDGISVNAVVAEANEALADRHLRDRPALDQPVTPLGGEWLDAAIPPSESDSSAYSMTATETE